MKLLWIGLLLVVSCLAVEAAVPQLTDFNTNQFGTAGGIVTIKNGALVTNLNLGPVYQPTNGTLTLLSTNTIVGSGRIALENAAVSAITWANTNLADFSVSGIQTVTLGGDWILESTNLTAGKSISIVLTGAATNCTMTFPATWKFIGASAPASLAATKVAVLSLTSLSTTDASVLAAFAAQP